MKRLTRGKQPNMPGDTREVRHIVGAYILRSLAAGAKSPATIADETNQAFGDARATRIHLRRLERVKSVRKIITDHRVTYARNWRPV